MSNKRIHSFLSVKHRRKESRVSKLRNKLSCKKVVAALMWASYADSAPYIPSTSFTVMGPFCFIRSSYFLVLYTLLFGFLETKNQWRMIIWLYCSQKEQIFTFRVGTNMFLAKRCSASSIHEFFEFRQTLFKDFCNQMPFS